MCRACSVRAHAGVWQMRVKNLGAGCVSGSHALTRDILVSTEPWSDCHLACVLQEGGWVVTQDLEGGSLEAHGPGPSTFFTASVLWEWSSSGSGRTLPLPRPLPN